MVLTFWVPSAWLAGLSFFLIGAGPVVWVIAPHLRQAVTPGHALGRVSAVILTATSGPAGRRRDRRADRSDLRRRGLLAIAAFGFLIQAAIILTSPIPHLARQPEMVG